MLSQTLKYKYYSASYLQFDCFFLLNTLMNDREYIVIVIIILLNNIGTFSNNTNMSFLLYSNFVWDTNIKFVNLKSCFTRELDYCSLSHNT